MQSRHWILIVQMILLQSTNKVQKESATENKHWLHIHHFHIRLDKDLFSNYAEDKTWRSNNHFLSKQIKETLKLNELTCRQLLPLCILTVFVAKCTMNQIMLVDHTVVLSQSKSKSSTDPTSYLEDRVVLDKVPDVQFSSNFHSRLK